jgi:hypothetical protein
MDHAAAAHPLLVLTSTPDLVEACIRAGRVEDARMAFAPLDAFAGPGAPPWIIARIAVQSGCRYGCASG